MHSWWGKDNHACCYARCFCGHCERLDFMFWKTNPCPSAPYLVVFTLLNWHCAISQLCSHLNKCYHCQPHSSWFGLVDCSFLWACYDSRDSFEGWCLSWLVPSKYVFPFNYRGIQMFTLVGGQVSSLMCQHGVGNERHWKPSFFSFVCIL